MCIRDRIYSEDENGINSSAISKGVFVANGMDSGRHTSLSIFPTQIAQYFDGATISNLVNFKRDGIFVKNSGSYEMNISKAINYDSGKIKGPYEMCIRDRSTTGWALNQATTVHVVSEHKQTGNLAISNGTGGYALRVTDYGTGEQWHGPSWTKKVPADRNGHVGAKNCTLSWHHYFTTSTFNNRGVIQFLMTDRNKKNVAAMTVFKNELGNNKGYAEFFVNGINKGKIEFDCNWNNPRTGQNAGKSSISKFGDRFEFNVNGEVKPFTVPEMKDIEVIEVSIFIGTWGSGEGIGENHVYSMEFTSHSVDAQRDVPNRFQAGSVVRIDGESTKVYVDGVVSAGHEVNGTDYFLSLIHI